MVSMAVDFGRRPSDVDDARARDSAWTGACPPARGGFPTRSARPRPRGGWRSIGTGSRRRAGRSPRRGAERRTRRAAVSSRRPPLPSGRVAPRRCLDRGRRRPAGRRARRPAVDRRGPVARCPGCVPYGRSDGRGRGALPRFSALTATAQRQDTSVETPRAGRGHRPDARRPGRARSLRNAASRPIARNRAGAGRPRSQG